MTAIAVPLVLSYELPPAQRMVQQCLSVLGWGLWLLLAARLQGFRHRLDWPLPAGLGLLLVAALSGPVWMQAGRSPALASAGLLGAALLVADAGRRQGQGAQAQDCFAAVCAAVLLAARINALIAVVQVALPMLPDLPVLATTRVPGRATGNLRHANHLASLLLWGMVATAHLQVLRERARGPWVPALDGVLLAAALVLSGSRWGLAGLLLLGIWVLVDRCTSPALRRVLVFAVVSCLATTLFCQWAGELGANASGLAARWQADTGLDAGRNGRWPVWKAAWSLALQHPWTGVGWGQFNLAWSLQPVADRGTALFNHAHNLPLQIWAELGLLLGSGLLALLGLALLTLLKHSIGNNSPQAPTLRTAWLFTLVMLGHSLLEFPLWHAYFLLPCVWLLAFGLAAGQAHIPAHGSRKTCIAVWLRRMLAAACLTAGAAALVDYLHVTHAPLPSDARGRAPSASLLFGHVADYRAAREASSVDAAVLRSALDFLVDPALLDRWALHLEQSGRTQDAMAIRRRLSEFASRGNRLGSAPMPDCMADHSSTRWRELLDLSPDGRGHASMAAGPC